MFPSERRNSRRPKLRSAAFPIQRRRCDNRDRNDHKTALLPDQEELTNRRSTNLVVGLLTNCALLTLDAVPGVTLDDVDHPLRHVYAVRVHSHRAACTAQQRRMFVRLVAQRTQIWLKQFLV